MANIQEINADMQAAIEALTEDELDEYNRFVAGSSPDILAQEFADKVTRLNEALVSDFLAAVFISATTHKRVLTDWLAEPAQAAISNYIRTEYFVADHINFTALNMIGHCILASNYEMTHAVVLAFRAKIAGDSLWDCNLRLSNVSDIMKRIFEERKARFSFASARLAGNTILAAILTRAGLDATIN